MTAWVFSMASSTEERIVAILHCSVGGCQQELEIHRAVQLVLGILVPDEVATACCCNGSHCASWANSADQACVCKTGKMSVEHKPSNGAGATPASGHAFRRPLPCDLVTRFRNRADVFRARWRFCPLPRRGFCVELFLLCPMYSSKETEDGSTRTPIGIHRAVSSLFSACILVRRRPGRQKLHQSTAAVTVAIAARVEAR